MPDPEPNPNGPSNPNLIPVYAGQSVPPAWTKARAATFARAKRARTMRDRLMVLVSTAVKTNPIAAETAKRMGLTMEVIEEMDFGELILWRAVFDALRGKAPQLVELIKRIDGNVPQVVQDDRLPPSDVIDLIRAKFGDDPRAAELIGELGEATKDRRRVILSYGDSNPGGTQPIVDVPAREVEEG